MICLRLVGDRFVCTDCHSGVRRPPPAPALPPRCLECGQPTDAGGFGFCRDCWHRLVSQASEAAGERMPCAHCGRESLLLFGPPGIGICPRCLDEASSVFREEPPSREDNDRTRDLSCSFCQHRAGPLGFLIAGPTVHICSGCVELFLAIEQSAQEDEILDPRLSCSFSGMGLLSGVAIITAASGAAICEQCLGLCREIVHERRGTAPYRTMRRAGPGQCNLCHQQTPFERGRLQIASGACFCGDCLGWGANTAILDRSVDREVTWGADRIVHGRGCMGCWATGDEAIVIGPPDRRYCVNCWPTRADRRLRWAVP